MTAPVHTDVRNRLLAGLAAADFELLRPHLVPVDLAHGAKLQEVGHALEDVWFPQTAVTSIISRSPRGLSAETGMIGREGVVEVCAVFGAAVSAFEVLVQVPGAALRMPAAKLRVAMEASPMLSHRILAFAHSYTVQASFTALLNTNFSIEERLARWLLMTHDRVDGDELQLTHDFLSLMLAVRRPSVTLAMHMLEGERYVQARRARVTILDRPALEEFASDGYGIPELAYERLLGPLGRRGAATREVRRLAG